MSQKDNDLQKIKKLIGIMKENELVELELKHGDDKILLKRSGPHQPAMTAVPMMAPSFMPGQVQMAHGQTPSSVQADDGLVEIKSPLVGTFYATPSPDSDPFVEIGSQVTPNSVVCIIEAMKVMNEVKADLTGTIIEIVAASGQAVEYGQVLFKVKPE